MVMTLVLHMWDSVFSGAPSQGLGFGVQGSGFRAKGLFFRKFWGGCKRPFSFHAKREDTFWHIALYL